MFCFYLKLIASQFIVSYRAIPDFNEKCIKMIEHVNVDLNGSMMDTFFDCFVTGLQNLQSSKMISRCFFLSIDSLTAESFRKCPICSGPMKFHRFPMLFSASF